MHDVIVIVIAAGIIGLAAVLLAPVRDWLARRSAVAAGHGLATTVERDPRLSGVYVLDGPVEFHFLASDFPSQAPPLSLVQWWSWAHDHGGEDVGVTALDVTLEATSDLSVVVDPPRVEQTITDVVPGKVAVPTEVGGGSVRPRRFIVDLDSDLSPRAVLVPSPTDPTATASFYLQKGDVERIEIIATAAIGRHEWVVVLPLIVDGKRVEQTIDDRGDPFVTVGVEDVHAASEFVAFRRGSEGWATDPAW